MICLSENLWFPDPARANADGLLAFGGDLSIERLLLAYRSGIFPWYDNQQPLLWWSPDPRMILFPHKFKVSKSLGKTIRNQTFTITINRRFREVIKNCARVTRKGQLDTWITPEMEAAYIRLHQVGVAMSIEAWKDDKLVGGLYGINLPERKVFCGESMFSLVSDASKVAFYHLCQFAIINQYKLIDCQVYNPHLASLGAEEIGREEFLSFLNE